MDMKVPFCYDPRKENYRVSLFHAKLKINETRVIVCDAVCPGCNDYLGKYPIKSAPEEDGYWRVRCMDCNSILYEELMVHNGGELNGQEKG